MPERAGIDDRYFTGAGLVFDTSRHLELRMGCLPVPLFFLVGFGIGYAVDGQSGALWGAGIGLALGLIGMGIVVKAMRGKDGR